MCLVVWHICVLLPLGTHTNEARCHPLCWVVDVIWIVHSHQLGQANVRFGDRTFLVPAPARSLRSRTVLDGPNQRELPAIQSAAQQELADRVEILEAELLKVCRGTRSNPIARQLHHCQSCQYTLYKGWWQLSRHKLCPYCA